MNKDKALNHLIAQLFLEPERIELILCHFPISEYPCQIHSHDNLLQLDLLVGLEGSAMINDKEVKLENNLAMAVYPNEKHGYLLEPGNKKGHVFSIKLRVENDLPAIKNRIFPSFTTNVTGKKVLIDLLQQTLRHSLNKSASSSLLLASLSEVLCVWPGVIIDEKQAMIPEIKDPEMDQVIMSIQQNLDNPPSIEELADLLSLSSRQFIRRFEKTYGMSAYKYITMLRLRRAKEHLAHGHLNVTEIANSLGFNTVNAFSRWFNREAGMRPSEYREPPSIY